MTDRPDTQDGGGRSAAARIASLYSSRPAAAISDADPSARTPEQPGDTAGLRWQDPDQSDPLGATQPIPAARGGAEPADGVVGATGLGILPPEFAPEFAAGDDDDPAGDTSRTAALPPVAARPRLLNVVALVLVGLLGAGALVALGLVVPSLNGASSRTTFLGFVLVTAGLMALLGVSRWLEHTLAARLADRYGDRLVALVVERSPGRPRGVARRGAHAVRAVRDWVAHIYGRLVPLACTLLGAGVALALIHPALPLVVAAPLLMLLAVAVSVAAAASPAARDERRARHDLTVAYDHALTPPELGVGATVEPVGVQVARPEEDTEPEPGEVEVADTLDPSELEELHGFATAGAAAHDGGTDGRPGTGSDSAHAGRHGHGDLAAALDRLRAANGRGAEALGTLRGAGLVVVGFALVAVGVVGGAVGLPVGETVAALVVTALAGHAVADVAEGARHHVGIAVARTDVGRALAGDLERAAVEHAA